MAIAPDLRSETVAKLRRIEALRSKGMTIAQVALTVGVSETEYRRWRHEFGGLLRTLRPGSP